MSESSIEESINLGAMSEALNDKMDRDGLNANINPAVGYGVDYVVEWKVPTDEDPTWYRKYASGWVEQGGINQSGTTRPIVQNLLITMANTNYTITHADCKPSATANMYVTWFYNKTISSFTYYFNGGGSGTVADYTLSWEVKGFAA